MRNEIQLFQDKLPIAIAGIGFGEKVHLKALYENKYLRPVAIWHPSQERLKNCSISEDLKRYNDWDLLLEDKEISGIIIATPPQPRFELSLKALNAKKHLLLEKPVAINSEEVKELQKISLNNQLSVGVDFEYRAVPHFIQAKKILSQSIIGEPWLVKLDWIMSSRANTERPWNWYSEKDKGGGVIGALGTHAFDMLHWLIGSTRSVKSTLSTSIKERLDPETNKITEVTSEDICLAQLELQSHDQKHIIPAQVTLSSVSKQGRGFWLEIYGSEGTLVLGSDNQKDYVHGFGLWFSKGKDGLKPVNLDNDIKFDKTWTDGRIAPVQKIQELWAQSIRLNNPMIPGLNEGLQSQKVCTIN